MDELSKEQLLEASEEMRSWLLSNGFFEFLDQDEEVHRIVSKGYVDEPHPDKD